MSEPSGLSSTVAPARKGCGPASVPLPVISPPTPAGAPRIRPSRAGPWRAAVLGLLHLVFIVHVAQWLLSGMRDGVRETLSPIEPSESMQTLEAGLVNAGFVVFVLAIVSTLIVGRFFCGWACHVVALQDACGWLMKKCGVHPKPWRSRLLLWVPLGLALYMFAWPTFRREVLRPAMDAWFGGMPDWMGVVYPRPTFRPHFIVEDFWATFPPWYIAAPFLIICGFATVYFLGAKAFCTYGCPYGGFFAPADRLAPVRIRVTDACNHCGHCTAVCTSNVRVSDEVRDYGAVVDPGCMKCLDCVSVCPNGALYVGVGPPAVLTRPRSEPAVRADAANRKAGRYDLSLREEWAMLVVWFLIFRGYRGMYESVPLLMAAGIAMIGTFMVHKSWRLLRDANVRGPYWQLKRSGRVTAAGALFAGATLLLAAGAVHGAVMWYGRWQGELAYNRLAAIDGQALFSGSFRATDEQLASARRVLALDGLSRPIGQGGIALLPTASSDLRLWWASGVVGDFASAEQALRRAMDRGGPRDDLVLALAHLMRLRQAPVAELESMLRGHLARRPAEPFLIGALADVLAGTGRAAEAVAVFERAAADHPADVAVVSAAARGLLALGKAERALPIVERALASRPRSAVLLEDRATMLFYAGRQREALDPLLRAIELAPTGQRWQKLADLYAALGEPDKARDALRNAGSAPVAPDAPHLPAMPNQPP